MYQTTVPPNRNRNPKKNSLVLTLVQTPVGYSLLDGEDMINKPTSTPLPPPPPPNPAPPKERLPPQPSAKRQNVIVPIYPYTAGKAGEHEEKYTTLASCATWFNINSVHEIERKSLSEWFRNRKGSNQSKTDRTDKNQQLYKKYRNHIIELSKDGYISSTKARKSLAGDACAIMRIHAFLEHWGIINYASRNQLIHHSRDLIIKFAADGKFNILSLRHNTILNNLGKLDLFDHDKNIISKHYSTDETEVLKRATKKYRPLCDYCGHRCGIVWFQHKRSLNSKESARINKNVNPKNQPIQPYEYEILLCIKCYSQGHFPVILSPSDFNKVSIHDRLNDAKFKKKREREGGELVPQEWSVDDISTLLELVGKHGDDWETIATHFKGRTEEDVVICFLNLPLRNISKLKFQVEKDDFIKSNSSELVNDDTSRICLNALNRIHQQLYCYKPQEVAHTSLPVPKDSNLESDAKLEHINGIESPQNQHSEQLVKQQVFTKQSPIVVQAAMVSEPRSQAALEQAQHQIRHPEPDPVQEMKLFEEMLQLYMKKIELKIGQLEEWQSSVTNAKKEIEESRKSVIAERIRNLIK